MLGVPDAVVHPSTAEVDQSYFFRRIHLRDCSDTRAHEKTQVLVGRANHVGIEERGMFRIVNRGEYVGIHVINAFLLEDPLRESFWKFVPMPYLVLPMLQGVDGFAGRLNFRAKRRSDFRI